MLEKCILNKKLCYFSGEKKKKDVVGEKKKDLVGIRFYKALNAKPDQLVFLFFFFFFFFFFFLGGRIVKTL